MSALWAPAGGGRPNPERAGSRPLRDRTQRDKTQREKTLRDKGRLKVVPPPPVRMARIPFIAVLIAVFGVGMAGLLLLNTTLQNQAFEGRALTRSANELIYSQAELESEMSRRSSTQELGRRASELGMRPNPLPAFLVVPSGKVLGKPTRVNGREIPSLVVKTPAQVAAAKKAAAAKRQAAAVEKAARERSRQLAAARRAAEQQAQAAQQAQAGQQAALRSATPGAGR